MILFYGCRLACRLSDSSAPAGGHLQLHLRCSSFLGVYWTSFVCLNKFRFYWTLADFKR